MSEPAGVYRAFRILRNEPEPPSVWPDVLERLRQREEAVGRICAESELPPRDPKFRERMGPSSHDYYDANPEVFIMIAESLFAERAGSRDPYRDERPDLRVLREIEESKSSWTESPKSPESADTSFSPDSGPKPHATGDE